MSSTSISTPTSTPITDRRRWIALVIVCLAQLMMVLDATIVNVALPSIQRDLHFSQASLTWVVNAYLISFGSFLLLAGRLGDLVGRKKVFLGGVVAFTAASALCGVAHSQAQLIAGRFAQGFGGAFAVAVIVALIVTDFPDPVERAKAMSVYIAVVSGGGAVGLLAGGLLTQTVSWHWDFFVNLPVGLAALLLGGRVVEENQGTGLGEGLDVAGSVLVTAALMAGIYAIVTSTDHGWGSAHTLGFGGAAVGLLAAFLALEARLANPIMPLRILRLRSLTASSAIRALVAAGMYAVFFLGALYLEHVLGYDAIGTGLAFMPTVLTVCLLSLGITTRLMNRFGARRLLGPALLVLLAGLALLARAGEQASYFPGLLIAFILVGFGAANSLMPLLVLAMGEVPARDAGLASGIINVSLQLGGAFGLAVLSTVAAAHTKALAQQGHSLAGALTGGYHLGFTVAAVIVALCIPTALVLLRSPKPEPERTG
jgi:EmrB/QacA subfamily drug resistance transporter